MNLQRATSSLPANFPWLVQVQNTENWNTSTAHLVEADAVAAAETLAERFPFLPVRVLHCKGGPIGC